MNNPIYVIKVGSGDCVEQGEEILDNLYFPSEEAAEIYAAKSENVNVKCYFELIELKPS